MQKTADARIAVAALLCAASNPQISEAQAKILIQEAAENAVLAFGLFAWHELIQIAIEQLDDKKLAPIVTMELREMFQNAEIDNSMS